MCYPRQMRWSSLSVFAVCVLSCPVVFGHALDHLADKSDIGINKIPNAGTSSILVLPVSVGHETSSAELADLQALFATDGGPGTFRQYWIDVSGGRYDPVPVVVDPVVYLDSCPLPGKTVADCTVGYEDLTLILSGGLAVALTDILTRLREEQDVDLGYFDINGIDGVPDGYFDGVVLATNMIEGVSPPLAALFNETIVPSQPGGGGPDISLSLIAAQPPPFHEFAHMFGFIDLYGGPRVNGLMGDAGGNDAATLSAFSRQQIGWGTVTEVGGPTEVQLPPVLESNQILRVGSVGGRYLLIENRSGALHAMPYETRAPGVYVYSVDEAALPSGSLGFIDIATSSLYLPNETPPYLSVATPVGCDNTVSASDPCALSLDDERELLHASGDTYGLWLGVTAVAEDGTATLRFADRPTAADPDPEAGPGSMSGGSSGDEGGCSLSAPAGAAPLAPWALLALLATAWRRRRLATVCSARRQ